MRYRFGCCWEGLRLDTTISAKLSPPQPAVSGDILILLPNRLVQLIYLNLARLMREGFRSVPRVFDRRVDALIGIQCVEKPDDECT